MKNGVQFVTPDSVYIEANVAIGKNSVIMGNTKLLGKTQIGEYCNVCDCTIVSSKVYDRVKLNGATLEKSVVEPDCDITAGTVICDGSLINKNTIIGRNNTIIKSSVGENVNILDNNYISNARIHDLCKIGACNSLIGDDAKIIRLLASACLGNLNKVNAGVMIGECVKIGNNKDISFNVRQGDNI